MTPPGRGGSDPLDPRWWWFTSVVIIAAGLGVRLIDLDFSFDGDEVFSATLASRPWGELVAHALADRTQAPLHILLLSGWSQISGGSEWGLRLSSLLFSLGFLIVLHQIAREQLEPWPGLMLLLIGALGTFFVANGQQLRPYSLALLLSCLSLRYFMRLMTRGWGRSDIMAWGLATALAISTSYVLALYALTQLGLLIGKYPRKALSSLTALALGLLPLGFWVWLAFSPADAMNAGLGLIGWIARPYVLDFCLFYIDLPGTLPGLPQWVSLIFLVVLALPALMKCRPGVVMPGLWPVLALALLPVLAVFAASQFLSVSIWATRQMTGSALAAILFLAMGFNGISLRLTQLAFGALGLSLLVSLPGALPQATRPAWREIIADADYGVGPDHDAVIINPADGWIRGPLERYLPAGTLIAMQDLGGGSSHPLSPLLMCRPLRCDAVLSAVQDAGYQVCGQQGHAWRSFGLVGSQRMTLEGAPASWSMAGGEPNARLTVMRLCRPTTTVRPLPAISTDPSAKNSQLGGN